MKNQNTTPQTDRELEMFEFWQTQIKREVKDELPLIPFNPVLTEKTPTEKQN